MKYIKDGKQHVIRPIHICEVNEQDKGTEIILVNGNSILLEEDFQTVYNVIFNDSNEILNAKSD